MNNTLTSNDFLSAIIPNWVTKLLNLERQEVQDESLVQYKNVRQRFADFLLERKHMIYFPDQVEEIGHIEKMHRQITELEKNIQSSCIHSQLNNLREQAQKDFAHWVDTEEVIVDSPLGFGKKLKKDNIRFMCSTIRMRYMIRYWNTVFYGFDRDFAKSSVFQKALEEYVVAVTDIPFNTEMDDFTRDVSISETERLLKKYGQDSLQERYTPLFAASA